MIDNRLQFPIAVVKVGFHDTTTTHPGLEKIEPILNTPGRLPLAHELTRMSSFTKADMNIALKLSEVIEAVNKMMEVMNKGVKE